MIGARIVTRAYFIGGAVSEVRQSGTTAGITMRKSDVGLQEAGPRRLNGPDGIVRILNGKMPACEVRML